MSPQSTRSQASASRFPRVSGDEPQSTEQAFVKMLFSPRERG